MQDVLLVVTFKLMCVNILIPDLRATALSFLNNGLKFYIFAHGLK